MDMSMEVGILLAYAFGIFIIYVIGYIFLIPVKVFMKIIGNSILAGVLIILINLIGSHWGIHIPLNFLSAIIVGILGIPGIFLIYFWM